LQSAPAECSPGWGRRLSRDRFSLGLTLFELALLLAVDLIWVLAWEFEIVALPSSYLAELLAMGFDAAYIACSQPAAWLPDAGLVVRLPDERLLRYCWRGVPRSGKAMIRAVASTASRAAHADQDSPGARRVAPRARRKTG